MKAESRVPRGRLSLVGLGPGDESGISVGALRAIQEAEELWFTSLGPINSERWFVRKYLRAGKKIVNLNAHYYLGAFPRAELYRFEAQRMVHLVLRGRRITNLYSGNPLYWVSATTIIKEMCFVHRFELQIIPSMSFLDTVFLSVPFLSATDLQVRLESIENPDISPEIDCVVGQVGALSTTGDPSRPVAEHNSLQRFHAALRRLYPGSHPLFVVGNHSVHSAPLMKQSTVDNLLEVLSRYRESTGWWISLVIPSLDKARRIEFLIARERQGSGHKTGSELPAAERAAALPESLQA